MNGTLSPAGCPVQPSPHPQSPTSPHKPSMHWTAVDPIKSYVIIYYINLFHFTSSAKLVVFLVHFEADADADVVVFFAHFDPDGDADVVVFYAHF